MPGAEFSLGVVDEAIYGIRPDTTLGILDFFFARDYNRVDTENSLAYYFNGQAGKRRMQLAGLRAPSRLAQLKPDRLVLPKIRKVFPDTAFWGLGRRHGRLWTRPRDGRVSRFPHNPGRATARGRYTGYESRRSDAQDIVRKNLILRIAAPRFFVQGDEVVLSALVHNYLTEAKTARVSLEVKGLDILDGGTKDVQIPSRGEAKVEWRVRVQQVHSATITGKALTNEESDAP